MHLGPVPQDFQKVFAVPHLDRVHLNNCHCEAKVVKQSQSIALAERVR